MMVDLLGQLETSYETRKGYWKGGTVGVFGYGGGIIPRFTELKDENGKPLFPVAAEFHPLRVQPPAAMHYSSDLLRKLCDVWIDSGTWRDNIRVNEAQVQDYYKAPGMHDLYNDVVSRCPTKAITVVASDKIVANPHTSVATWATAMPCASTTRTACAR